MAIYNIQAPDGRKIRIEAADEQTAVRGAQEWYAGQQPKPKTGAYGDTPKRGQARGWKDEVSGFMANLNRSLLIGDEVTAAGMTAGNVLSGKTPMRNVLADFGDNMKTVRGVEQDFQTRRPLAAGTAQGLGNTGLLLMPSAPIIQGGGVAMNVGRGVTAASATAAGYGALDAGTAKERLDAANRNALNPLVVVLGAAAGKFGTPKAPRTVPAKAKNAERLGLERNAAYQAADQSGVQYTPQAFNQMVSNIEGAAVSSKLNPMRHPKAASMLDELKEMAETGTSPSLTELDQLRQVVRRDVANAADEAEQFFGSKMIREIDDFIAKAGASDVLTGNADDAASLIKTAREANTRFRKVEAVEEGAERARLRAGGSGSGGNIDNATRSEMRRVLENTPNLTPEETAALEKVVMGGEGQNLLRLAGKLSPGGNGLQASISIASMGMLGKLGAIPGIGGLISKMIADGMTRRNVNELVRLMSTNGAKTVVPGAPAMLSAPAAAKLTSAAGVGGGAMQNGPPQPRNVLATVR